MTILVTGATGFVGKRLVGRLAQEQQRVRAAVRTVNRTLPPEIEQVALGDLGPDTDWGPVLRGVTAIVHLAARVHVMRDASVDPLAEFRRMNVDVTLALARRAAAADVRRLVFLSSVKVNGETGNFRESDPPHPVGPYAVSKHEAEVGLRAIARETRLEVVIIRPPLVYGPGVTANFRSLINAITRGLPLPLGSVPNKRSFVSLDNLVDFVIACVDHSAARNETFFVSDGEDVSTSDLIRRLARVMARPARLVPVPVFLLYAASALVGRRDIAQRLLGSLQLDISKATGVLGWKPPVSLDDGLRAVVSSA